MLKEAAERTLMMAKGIRYSEMPPDALELDDRIETTLYFLDHDVNETFEFSINLVETAECLSAVVSERIV